MQTSVTQQGQTAVPAAIRKRYHMREGDQLVWLDDGKTIQVAPTSADLIQALRLAALFPYRCARIYTQ